MLLYKMCNSTIKKVDKQELKLVGRNNVVSQSDEHELKIGTFDTFCSIIQKQLFSYLK